MRRYRAAAARAASGEMTMMTSGPAAVYAKIEDILSGMAGKVYRLGDEHGIGAKVKIINQLLAGVHICGFGRSHGARFA